jgi:hypothetical protein
MAFKFYIIYFKWRKNDKTSLDEYLNCDDRNFEIDKLKNSIINDKVKNHELVIFGVFNI